MAVTETKPKLIAHLRP